MTARHRLKAFLATFATLAGLSGRARAQLNCSVNVSTGLPWTVGTTQYNWVALNITTNGTFSPATGWGLEVGSNAVIDTPWDWNATSTARVGNGFRVSGVVPYYWEPLVPGGTTDLGFVAGANTTPVVDGLSVRGSACRVGEPLVVSPVGRTESGLQPVSVSGIQLLGVDGRPLVLKGINWFGFEEPGNSMLDGLWLGDSSITLDFATIVYRLQLLGFNSVRLPMSFQNLYGGTPPRSYTQSCNTDTQQTVVSSTTDPSVNAPPSSSAPTQPSPPPQTPGLCSSELPNDSTINRFLYIVRFFAQQGIYVVVDNHLNLDPTAIEDPTAWLGYWTQFATSIAADPLMAAYTILEILNEPDVFELRWEAYNGLPGAGDLTLRAMDAIYAVNPAQTMMVEGCGQIGPSICWVRAQFAKC